MSRLRGGTLFFDEIGELDLAVQKKLLRTLQERRLRPVGSRKELPVDFRLVAATNRDLEKRARNKEFREDLLFRIRGIEIKLPPLRERVEDIQSIVCNKIRQIGNHYGHGTKGVSAEFIEILGKYGWPGNVRELINVLEHSIANAGSDPTLVPKHFPPAYRAALLELGHGSRSEGYVLPMTGTCFVSDGQIVKWTDYRFQTEKTYLQGLLSESKGNWVKACRLAGFSKSRLYELLKKHNLSLSPV